MSRSVRIASFLLAAVAALALAACGSSDKKSSSSTPPPSTPSGSAGGGTLIKSNPANSTKSITVGSKNFTEEFILGNIYAQALQAAGYKVKKQLNLGSEQIAYKALKGGQVDAYPEYTGTALTSFFAVKPADVPVDPTKAYEQTKADFAKQGITALAPTPYSNTYAVSSTKATAKKLGNPTTLSELKGKDKGLTLSGFPECKQRADCLVGLQKTYGLTGLKFVSSQGKEDDLDKGVAKLAMLFATDGQLTTGKYVTFADDKHLFPPYNITFNVRTPVLARLGPDAKTVIESVQKGMTDKVMKELNSRVDLDKQKPEDVATQYLKESGLIQ